MMQASTRPQCFQEPNRFMPGFYVTSTGSTKGFGRGVGRFSNGTPLSGLLASGGKLVAKED